MGKPDVHGGDSSRAPVPAAESTVWPAADGRWRGVVDAFREELARAVFGDLGRVIQVEELGAIPSWSGQECATAFAYESLENMCSEAIEALPAHLIRVGVTQLSCVITRDGFFGAGRDRTYYERLFALAGFRLMTEMTPILARIPAPVAWDAGSERAIWGLSHLHWNDLPGQLFFIRE